MPRLNKYLIIKKEMPDFAVIIEDKSNKYLFSNDNDDCENSIIKEEYIGYRKKKKLYLMAENTVIMKSVKKILKI